MKTIVRKPSNVSLYLFADSKQIDVQRDKVVIGNPTESVILDCNSMNSRLHQNVTPPEDWVGLKYLFDGVTWTQNPNWVDVKDLTINGKNIA